MSSRRHIDVRTKPHFQHQERPQQIRMIGRALQMLIDQPADSFSMKITAREPSPARANRQAARENRCGTNREGGREAGFWPDEAPREEIDNSFRSAYFFCQPCTRSDIGSRTAYSVNCLSSKGHRAQARMPSSRDRPCAKWHRSYCAWHYTAWPIPPHCTVVGCE